MITRFKKKTQNNQANKIKNWYINLKTKTVIKKYRLKMYNTI